MHNPWGEVSCAPHMDGATSQRASACVDANTAAGYVAGNLTPAEALRVDEHVDACAACRRLLRAVAQSTTGGDPSSSRDRRVPSSLDAATLLSGTHVGRYVVQGPLGVGAMGVVVRALDPALGRQVALKRVRVDVPELEAWQERLKTEARAMAQLSHPNVVAVYDLVIHEQHLFIAMELIDGVSLRAWLAEKERGWREVVTAFLQAGAGLAAAHAVGLVHRDFKPENVLRSREGRVCVTDFGLADPGGGASGDRPAGAGALAGTPAYMAPEQLRGEQADARSDQYSFCVSLYEALHGERPARQDRASEPTGRRTVPQWVRRILQRGLRAAPADRYPSMQALLADLGRDRRTRWLRATAVAGVVASAACVILAYRNGRAASTSATCRAGDAELAAVWSAAQADGVRDALLGTHKPYAADAWRGVQQALDAYGRAWTAMHTDACEATQVRGEQSTEAMDLRMTCLGDRLKDMSSVVEALEHADDGVVSHARSLADSLTPVAVCADVAALRARVKPPADPAVAKRIEELQGDLRRAKTMALAGKLRDALPIAAAASSAADAIGYAPLQAEASYRFGGLTGMTGDLEHGQAELLRGAHFADAAGDDRTRTEICRLLMYNAGRQGKADLVPVFREEAMAAIERRGGDDQAQARLLASLAGAQVELGQFVDAQATGKKALALSEKAFGPDARSVSDALINLGIADAKLGALGDARHEFERASSILVGQLGAEHPDSVVSESNIADVALLALDLAAAESHYRHVVTVAEATWGKEHFRVGRYLAGLGETLLVEKRWDEAEPMERHALAISEKALGAQHPRLVEPLWGIGVALMGLGRAREAIAPLERALTLRVDDPYLAARAKLALAEALAATGGDAQRARKLAAEARDTFEHTPESPRVSGLLEETRSWLAAHGGST